MADAASSSSKIASDALCVPCDTCSVVTKRLSVDVTLHMLYEGNYDAALSFPALAEVGTDRMVTASDIPPSYLTRDGSRFASMQFGCCLVQLSNVKGNTTNVLLDTACGDGSTTTYLPRPLPLSLVGTLKSIGVSTNDIHIVIHSHLHADHCGNNVTDGKPTFPHATHFVHRAEYEFSKLASCPWREDAAKMFEPIEQCGHLAFIQGASCLIDAVREIGHVNRHPAPQIEVLAAHGHTPGHVAVRIQPLDAQSRGAIYIGDAMHFPLQVEKPEWSPSNFDCCGWPARKAWASWPWILSARCAVHSVLGYSSSWNRLSAVEARTALLATIADSSALLLSPHFPAPGMGRVVRQTNAPANERAMPQRVAAPAVDRFTYMVCVQ